MQHAPQIGESTAVLAVVSNGVIQGASVGDSVALLVGTRELHDLTGAQPRKPLLGSGEAVPVEFGAELRGRTLILATDGLHKYWRRGDAHRALTAGDAAVSLRLLVESVRLPGGSLQDDVGIVLIRPLA
jgi:serine/threonine protein phosphatase PrpC